MVGGASADRDKGRYSMGAASASRQQLHNVEWAEVLTDTVLDAMDDIFGRAEYYLCGGGGELVLAGTKHHQD